MDQLFEQKPTQPPPHARAGAFLHINWDMIYSFGCRVLSGHGWVLVGSLSGPRGGVSVLLAGWPSLADW